MLIRKLIWSESILDKLDWKHHITPEEVYQVILGRHYAVRGSKGVYYLYGQTEQGRYLFVVLADRENGYFKVITARDMTQADRQLFQRKIK
ncbi:MAG: hypothetical protein AB1791_12070 [Chloroflexota bacterium]